MQEQLNALANNQVDVIQSFEPFVTQALLDGGHLLYEASLRGPTVYTGFITSRATLAARHKEVATLDAALAQALSWIREAGAEATAELVKAYFPELTHHQLTSAATRYLERGVWSDSTTINRAGFERLSESFFRGGAIRAPANYESCVFNFGDH
jgi:NitT/TauT family transport system substrate-binding protein